MPVDAIPDLWPSDLAGPATVTPVAVLRRQAEALGTRTQNFVTADIETRTIGNGTQFEHNFVLTAPFLRFRFPLFRVTHGIQPFPATVVETDLTRPQTPGTPFWNAQVHSEDELIKTLEGFFQTERVKSVVRSLITQSNDFAPEGEER